MLSKYYNQEIDNIRSSFEKSYEDSIKILLCNIKLENALSKFNSIISSLKDDKLDEVELFSDIKNVTNDDLCKFIEDSSFMRLQKNKCFIEIYEDFEKTLKAIVEYIHYKKPNLTFNKNNDKINGSVITSILENDKGLENIITINISNNVNKIVYGRNIVEIIEFISRYSKVKIDENTKKGLLIASNTRNVIVHNKGNLEKEDVEKLAKLIGNGFNKNYKKVSMTSSSIKVNLDKFITIIDDICEGIKTNLG